MKKALSLLLICAMLVSAACAASAAQPMQTAARVQSVSTSSAKATLTVNDDITVKALNGEPSPSSVRYTAYVSEAAFPALVFTEEPKKANAAVFAADATDLSDGSAIFMGGLDELEKFQPHRNGDFLVLINAVFESAEGQTRFLFKLSYDVPLTLAVDGTPKQGDSFLLRADYLPLGEEMEVTAETDMNFTPTFYPYEGSMVAFMPAKYSADAGLYHITLTCGEQSEKFEVNVADGKFVVQVQNFAIDKSVADATVNNTKANDDYEKVTRPLKNLGDPQKYWEGKFQLPLKKENISTSSPFGIIRIINGSKDQHAGIDYPAPTGTPVYAPNNGRVLFAGFLQLTGNMVCIEHGFGLKSWYYHMSGVTVEAGDMVKTGDQIGMVGATGFVTGPHLHFTMSINNVYVNPTQFLNSEVLP